MKTITMPLGEYEQLKERAQACDDGKVHVSYSALGMGCHEYEIIGCSDDAQKIIRHMNEEYSKLRKEFEEFKYSVQPKNQADTPTKKSGFFRW